MAADDRIPDPGERLRIVYLFALLALCGLGVLARLAWLQGQGATAARRSVAAQRDGSSPIPAPRGSIRDRFGVALAWDRPVFRVQAELYVRVDADRSVGPQLERARSVVESDVLWALRRDPDLAGDAERVRAVRSVLAGRLERRIASRWARWCDRHAVPGAGVAKPDHAALQRIVPAEVPQRAPREPFELKIDLLVAKDLADADALAALRRLDYRVERRRRRPKSEPRPYRVAVHVLDEFEREAVDAELYAGLVGHLNDAKPVAGLERVAALASAAPGERRWWSDAARRPYWSGGGRTPEPPVGLVTSIDPQLQAAARIELDAAVEHVAERYGKRIDPGEPEWAAMVLVDVPTGEIRAMTGFARGPDRANDVYAAFAPTQQIFEPGSIVKPLHVALAVERGVYGWDFRVDCSPGYQCRYKRARRTIRDSHRCGVLTPEGVLVNSSNIGAVRLGLMLGSAGIQDYVDAFEFGSVTGLPLPERSGARPKTLLAKMRPAEQQVWTGPSLVFGYGMSVTPVQVARAYLTLLSGRPRELRLVTHLERDGVRREVAARTPDASRFLSERTLGLVTRALIGVVDGRDGSTAKPLARELKRLGAPVGLVAGKTGTSEYGVWERDPKSGERRKRMIRTASFAGFAPAAEPRFLVVCVLQKVGADAFFGGSYAAPAAGRLLLTALEREQGLRNGSPSSVRTVAGRGRGAAPR